MNGDKNMDVSENKEIQYACVRSKGASHTVACAKCHQTITGNSAHICPARNLLESFNDNINIKWIPELNDVKYSLSELFADHIPRLTITLAGIEAVYADEAKLRERIAKEIEGNCQDPQGAGCFVEGQYKGCDHIEDASIVRGGNRTR